MGRKISPIPRLHLISTQNVKVIFQEIFVVNSLKFGFELNRYISVNLDSGSTPVSLFPQIGVAGSEIHWELISVKGGGEGYCSGRRAVCSLAPLKSEDVILDVRDYVRSLCGQISFNVFTQSKHCVTHRINDEFAKLAKSGDNFIQYHALKCLITLISQMSAGFYFQ